MNFFALETNFTKFKLLVKTFRDLFNAMVNLDNTNSVHQLYVRISFRGKFHSAVWQEIKNIDSRWRKV